MNGGRTMAVLIIVCVLAWLLWRIVGPFLVSL